RHGLADLPPGAEQVAQPFALFEATEEQDVQSAVLELGYRRHRLAEPLDVDAVGNDSVLTREMLADEIAGRRRYGDLAVQLSIEVFQEGLGRQIGDRGTAGHVEGTHVSGL